MGHHLGSLLGVGGSSFRLHLPDHALRLFRQLMATAAVLAPGAAPALTDDMREFLRIR